MSLSSSLSPAVEVVATFGDSIVGVRHVTNPRGGRTTAATRALVLGGALSIAIGAIGFFVATRIAAANHAELAAWVGAGKPAWAFRAELVPTWLAVVSMLGLSLGLTALVGGLARRKRELEPSTISIGSAAGVDFAIGGTTSPRHALIAPAGDGFVVDLTGMTGEIAGPHGCHSIAPMAAAVPVLRGMTVRATLGKVGLHVTAIEAPRRQTTPVLALFDRRAASYLAASAAAHLALWAFARTVPPDADEANVGLYGLEVETMQVRASINDTTPPELEPADAGDTGGVDGQAAMALETGTVGAPDASSADPAKRKIASRSDSPQLARKAALEAARSAGLLGSSYAGGDLFASVVGTGAVSSGFDDLDLIGGFDGHGDGAPTGFGQGRTGFDVGGGGWSFRVGGYNTIKDGRDAGDGWGIPNGRKCEGACRDRDPRVPRLGKPTEVSPGYDKEIVRRYVHRKLAQIGYCYDKQLLVSPDIAGTVMAEWTISPTGTVTGAVADGVHPAVAGCIAQVVATIKFPRPPAIGIFKVRYPFTLRRPAS